MRIRELILLPILLSCCSQGATLVETPQPVTTQRKLTGSYEISESEATIHDPTRNRDIPMRIYAPRGATERVPVVIFSHGLGSSRHGYAYLGRHWASHGYLVIHPQHAGSDSEHLRNHGLYAAYRSAYITRNWSDRTEDVSRVLDALERNGDGNDTLRIAAAIADPSRVAVAGHSYGAHTTYALSGMLVNFPGQKGRSLADPRVRAAIAMSAPPMTASPTPAEFAPIRIPVLHMTGTRDWSIIFRTRLSHRSRPFRSIEGPAQVFVNLTEGAHRTFADLETDEQAVAHGRLDAPEPLPRTRTNPWHEAHIAAILHTTTTFLDAILKEDATALSSIRDGSLTTDFRGVATYESKGVS